MSDDLASSAFFRAYSPRLRAFLEPRISPNLRRRFDADDVLSSAFRSFFLRPRNETDRADDWNPWPLLMEITIHKLARQVRRHQAASRAVVREQGQPDQITAENLPGDLAELAEIQHSVEAALAAQERKAWRLRLEGYEILEIAEQLFVNERTVRRYLSQAKRRLKELLDASRSPDSVERTIVSAVDQVCWTPFSRYTLQRLIGVGLVGKVYLALDKHTETMVAIKFLKKEFLTSSVARDSILAEMRFGMQLKHPLIVRLHGIGETPNDGLFLVMDYLSGGSLAQRLRLDRPGFQALKGWLGDLIDGLEAAHAAGILHGDVKPANVLFDETNRPKIADFGFAQWMTGCGPEIRGGTPAYLAPELMDPMFGEPGPWTDVFGLGAIIRESLIGEPPFAGATAAEVFQQIVSADAIRWPDRMGVPIPASWRDFCDLCLRKATADRPSSMRELRAIAATLPEG